MRTKCVEKMPSFDHRTVMHPYASTAKTLAGGWSLCRAGVRSVAASVTAQAFRSEESNDHRTRELANQKKLRAMTTVQRAPARLSCDTYLPSSRVGEDDRRRTAVDT